MAGIIKKEQPKIVVTKDELSTIIQDNFKEYFNLLVIEMESKEDVYSYLLERVESIFSHFNELSGKVKRQETQIKNLKRQKKSLKDQLKLSRWILNNR